MANFVLLELKRELLTTIAMIVQHTDLRISSSQRGQHLWGRVQAKLDCPVVPLLPSQSPGGAKLGVEVKGL